MKRFFILFIGCCFSLSLSAQSITVTSGSLDFIKGEKVLETSYTYNDMLVGRMTEKEYVDKKVSEYNAKEEGRGDSWRESWIRDRERRFEPIFEELFNKHMEGTGIVVRKNQGATYRLEINTDFTEPGFNVGVVRKNATIDLTCSVFNMETGEHVAAIKIRNSSANSFMGTDFDAGYRIQECYAKAGRELAKFIRKKAKLK